MKLLVCFLMLMAYNASASEIEVPKLFVDSTITTTLKNGKQFTFDGNEWMVVRRKPKINLVQSNETVISKKELSFLKDNQQKDNRVRILGGIGPTGFKHSSNSNSVEISTKSGAVGGLGYDRMLNKNMSLGGQALSNGTFLLGAGYDF